MFASSGIEACSLESAHEPGGIHLSALESHRATFTRMQSLAAEAGAGWVGEAGADFKAAMDAWLGNYLVVGGVLDQMREHVVAHRAASVGTQAAATVARQGGTAVADSAGLAGA